MQIHSAFAETYYTGMYITEYCIMHMLGIEQAQRLQRETAASKGTQQSFCVPMFFSILSRWVLPFYHF